MSATNNNGPMATLLLPTSNLVLIGFAKTVLDSMQGNAQFPTPTPTLALFAADVTALEDSETEAAKRTKGAATLRDARSKKVKVGLKQLRAYVQSVADAELDPALAAAIIESAFMSVRKAAQRMKDELRVRNTSISGAVALDARAVGLNATYFWQYSLDQKTWINVLETMKAKTVISGLTSGQTHYFRFRALTRSGPIDYGQIVSLLVH